MKWLRVKIGIDKVDKYINLDNIISISRYDKKIIAIKCVNDDNHSLLFTTEEIRDKMFRNIKYSMSENDFIMDMTE